MYREAIQDYDHALLIYPENSEVYINRAYAYSKLGNDLQSMSDYDIAIKMGGTNLMHALFNRGMAYIGHGQREQGLSDLDRACELKLMRACERARKIRAIDP